MGWRRERDGFSTHPWCTEVWRENGGWSIGSFDDDDPLFIPEDEKDDFIAGLIELRRQERSGDEK